MEQVFSQLGQLFVQTIPTVILVFVLVLVLERLFFRPLSRVMDRREEATSGALARAREQAAAAEEKARQYEEAFRAARQNVYRERDESRRRALADREAALGAARERAESLLKDAQAALANEVEAAKRELGRGSHTLASEIADVILGDRASNQPQGSVAG